MLARVARLPSGAWSRPRDGAQDTVFAPSPDGVFRARIPPELRGVWVLAKSTSGRLATLILSTGANNAPLTEVLLGSRQILFVPGNARWFCLQPFGPGSVDVPVVRLTALGRAQAMLSGCARRPFAAAAALVRVALRHPPRPLLAARAELARVITAEAHWPRYAQWCALFDTEVSALPPKAPPRVMAVVVHDGRSEEARAATLEALTRSEPRVPVLCLGPADPWPQLDCDYAALLQAGELPRPHALSALRNAATQRPAAVFADDDQLDRKGRRSRPNFKPHPSRLALRSGRLASGIWLVRPEWLDPDAPRHAEAMRIDAARYILEAGQLIGHVPAVLTHCRRDTSRFVAPAAQERQGERRRVSILIASTLQRARVKCLRAILERTAYAELEIIVVVSQPGALDAAQEHGRALLEADKRVRVITHRTPRFNYAVANNIAARRATGNLLCLLNDDVVPLHTGWLQQMVRHFDDRRTGVVGATLFFPDRTIQHAGIVLRPDGTGEHAGRGARRAPPTREVSAVTGACMLTRGDVFDRLGGLDESFPSAFNDVDYCLRVRDGGYAVAVSAEARLIHHESATYGRHYGSDESARAEADRARLLDRWPAWFAEDPFHSPNLSRQPGFLDRPAFPPRKPSTALMEAPGDALDRFDHAPARGPVVPRQEFERDGIDQPAEARGDRLGDALIGRTRAKQVERFVRNQSRHVVPAPLPRQTVQPGAEILQPVQREDAMIGGG